MLSDFTGADKVYIACGYTDLRRGIDGLADIVQQEFQLDPFTNTLFLFCGRRRDRIKALVLERQWICAAVQASGIRFLPMAAKRKRGQKPDCPTISLAHGRVKCGPTKGAGIGLWSGNCLEKCRFYCTFPRKYGRINSWKRKIICRQGTRIR